MCTGGCSTGWVQEGVVQGRVYQVVHISLYTASLVHPAEHPLTVPPAVAAGGARVHGPVADVSLLAGVRTRDG